MCGCGGRAPAAAAGDVRRAERRRWRRRRRPAGGSAAGAEGWRREEPWEVLLSALYVPDAPSAAAQPLLLTGPAE